MSLSTSHFDELHLCTGRKVSDVRVITQPGYKGVYKIEKLSDGWSVFFHPDDSPGEVCRLATGLQDVLGAKAAYLEHRVARIMAIRDEIVNKSDK